MLSAVFIHHRSNKLCEILVEGSFCFCDHFLEADEVQSEMAPMIEIEPPKDEEPANLIEVHFANGVLRVRYDSKREKGESKNNERRECYALIFKRCTVAHSDERENGYACERSAKVLVLVRGKLLHLPFNSFRYAMHSSFVALRTP